MKKLILIIIGFTFVGCNSDAEDLNLLNLENTSWGCMYNDIEYIITFYGDDAPEEGYKYASIKMYDDGDIDQSPLYYKYESPNITLYMYKWHSYELLPVPFSETVEGEIYNEEMIFKWYSFNLL